MAKLAAIRGGGETYDRMLEYLAVMLYRDAILTLGERAHLLGRSTHDFIALRAALDVPILWLHDDDLGAEVDAMEAALSMAPSTA